MSSNEESFLACVAKLLDDATTPSDVIEIMFDRAMELDYAKVVQRIMLSSSIDSYLAKHSVESMLLESFEQLKQYKIVELFLSNQSDRRLEFSSDNLFFLLKWASTDGQYDVVKKLLKFTNPSEEFSYAFRIAAYNGHQKIIELLLADKRVDPEAVNNAAIKEAFGNGHHEIVKLLIPLVDMSKIDIAGIHELNKPNPDYEEAKVLLKMISKEQSYYTIGNYLCSIDKRLFTEWMEFSECPDKERLESQWKIFVSNRKQGTWAIGSLRLLAFQDNPKKFMDYQNNKTKTEAVVPKAPKTESTSDYLCHLIKNGKYAIDLHGKCGALWYDMQIDGVSYALNNSGKEISIAKLESIAMSTFYPIIGDIQIHDYDSFRVNDHLSVKYIYSSGDINEYEITHVWGPIGQVGQHGGLRVRFPFVLGSENVVECLGPEIRKTIKPGHVSTALSTLEKKPLKIAEW